jgi:uncharacterized protein
MDIHLEKGEGNVISSYDNDSITLRTNTLHSSCIVTKEHIIKQWPIDGIKCLNISEIKPFHDFDPEVIIIGHKTPGLMPPFETISYLSNHRIGIEFMDIGGACRTYNILVAEKRRVCAGFIF